jgi:Coenzyme PQQ synthesis protein D (PqqD)
MRLRLRRENLNWRALDGEIMALDSAASIYLGANEAGALLWQKLVEGTTQGELESVLTTEYGIDAATAEADVDHFLAELTSAGLLEESDAAA